MAMKIYLAAISTYLIITAAVPFFYNRTLVNKKTESDFAGNKKLKKRYILHQRINLFAAGTVIFISLFLPQRLMVPFAIPLLAVVFVSILCCNKYNLGRWTAWKKF